MLAFENDLLVRYASIKVRKNAHGATIDDGHLDCLACNPPNGDHRVPPGEDCNFHAITVGTRKEHGAPIAVDQSQLRYYSQLKICCVLAGALGGRAGFPYSCD